MTIATVDIKWFYSNLFNFSIPAQNGGRFTENECVTNVKNNLFPDTSASQRATGVEHWRKVFIGIRNTDNSPLIDPKISIQRGSPGDSYIFLYTGTHTDTQNQVTGRPYAYGVLNADVAANATTLIMKTERDFSFLPVLPFQVGDTIRVDSRASITDTAGTCEYHTISALTHNGDVLEITLTKPLNGSYIAGTHIASVITAGNIKASYDNLTNAGTVTYTDTDGTGIIVPNKGGVYQTWTVTITDGMGTLSVTGDTLGAVGGGSMGAVLEPSNPNGGAYFTLKPTGWSSSTHTGSITFTTYPAAVPVWYRRIVPAGAAPIATDPTDVCIEGES